MKKLILASLAILVGFTLYSADRIEDVYDLFNPGTVGAVSFGIDGECSGQRVSLFYGKNPLAVDEDGKPVKRDEKGNLLLGEDGKPLVQPRDMPDPHPNVITRYCAMQNQGGEDNRAFHMGGSCGISRTKWTKIIITFVPRLDGKVRFSVGGNYGGRNFNRETKEYYKYPNYGFVRYAKFSIKNSKFNDPLISKWSNWGIPMSNYYPQVFKDKIKITYTNEKLEEAPFTKALRSTCGLSQIIPVKKNKEVTISFYVRADDCFSAKF